VTQRHIDEAIPKDSSHCMITEAIKEALPNAKFVSTDLQTIRWTDPQKKLRYIVLTPQLAQIRLIAFDQGDLDNLEPFEFTLRPNQITKTGKSYNHAPDDPVETPDAAKNVIDGAVEDAQRATESAIEGAEIPAMRSETSVIDDKPAEAAVETVETSPKLDSPRKPRRKYTFRRRLAKPDAPGAVPVTLGGTRLPHSVLARREFGLRVLRR
jgi:hypothetical protein